MRKASKPKPQDCYRVQENGLGKKVKTFDRIEDADAYAVAMSLANNDGGVGYPIAVRSFERAARGWRLTQVVEVRATIVSDEGGSLC